MRAFLRLAYKNERPANKCCCSQSRLYCMQSESVQILQKGRSFHLTRKWGSPTENILQSTSGSTNQPGTEHRFERRSLLSLVDRDGSFLTFSEFFTLKRSSSWFHTCNAAVFIFLFPAQLRDFMCRIEWLYQEMKEEFGNQAERVKPYIFFPTITFLFIRSFQQMSFK